MRRTLGGEVPQAARRCAVCTTPLDPVDDPVPAGG